MKPPAQALSLYIYQARPPCEWKTVLLWTANNHLHISGLSLAGQSSELVPFVCDLISMTPTAVGTELIQKLFVSLLLLLIRPHRTTKRPNAAVSLSWLKVPITAAKLSLFSPWQLHPSQVLRYCLLPSWSYRCFESAGKYQLTVRPNRFYSWLVTSSQLLPQQGREES